MNCPKCKSENVSEISNLHSVWGCRDCGYQADGAEFDPVEDKAWHKVKTTALMVRWLIRGSAHGSTAQQWWTRPRIARALAYYLFPEGSALRELADALLDALRCGDLLGHLRSWWRTVTGRVSPEDLVILKGGPNA